MALYEAERKKDAARWPHSGFLSWTAAACCSFRAGSLLPNNELEIA